MTYRRLAWVACAVLATAIIPVPAHGAPPTKCLTNTPKGKQVYVEGRLKTRSYDDKDGKKVYRTEVIADDVLLLGGRAEGAAGVEEPRGPVSMPRNAQRPATPHAPAEDSPFEPGITDDDVPF